MINIEELNIATIPVISLTPHNSDDLDKHLVFLYHGWKQSKEEAINVGYILAKSGLHVMIPETPLHGSRYTSDENRDSKFAEILMQSAAEFEILRSSITHFEIDKVSVCGWSMGGIIAAMILSKYTGIHAVGILMGTPKLYKFMEYLVKTLPDAGIYQEMIQSESFKTFVKPFDLSENVSKLNESQVYFWHALNDSVVPAMFTKEFIQEIEDSEFERTVNYTFNEKAGHRVPLDIYYELANFLTK